MLSVIPIGVIFHHGNTLIRSVYNLIVYIYKSTLLIFSPNWCGMQTLRLSNPAFILCMRLLSLLLAISRRNRFSLSTYGFWFAALQYKKGFGVKSIHTSIQTIQALYYCAGCSTWCVDLILFGKICHTVMKLSYKKCSTNINILQYEHYFISSFGVKGPDLKNGSFFAITLKFLFIISIIVFMSNHENVFKLELFRKIIFLQYWPLICV